MIGTDVQGEDIGEPFGDVDWEPAPLGLLEDQLTLFAARIASATAAWLGGSRYLIDVAATSRGVVAARLIG